MMRAERYLNSFREALTEVVMRYAEKYPLMATQDLIHYEKVRAALQLIGNLELTPMMLWTEMMLLEGELPRSFWNFFRSELGDGLTQVLARFPLETLRISYEQVQFVQRQSQTERDYEVRGLRTELQNFKEEHMEKYSRLEEKFEKIQIDYVQLRQENARLVEENAELKHNLGEMQKALASYKQLEVEKEEAVVLRDQQFKEKIAELVEEKSQLYERCHKLLEDQRVAESLNSKLLTANEHLKQELLVVKRMLKEPQASRQPTASTARLSFFARGM